MQEETQETEEGSPKIHEGHFFSCGEKSAHLPQRFEKSADFQALLRVLFHNYCEYATAAAAFILHHLSTLALRPI